MELKKNFKRFFTLDRRNEGFTLVELIVVIAILAILGAVAIPAYNTYIERADRAGDDTLLAAVNKAFNAAVAAEGHDIYTVNSANMPVDADGKVDSTAMFPAEYKDNFDLFYQENEDAAFKVYSVLVYNPTLHVFQGVQFSDEYQAILDTLTGEEYAQHIANLKASVFNEIGYGTLAGQIDNASGLLAGFVGQTSSGFHSLLTNSDNMTTLSGYASGDEINAMIAANYEKINNDPQYADLNDTQKQNLAQGQVLANSAILTAAKNPDAITSDFITSLENGTAVDLLKTSTDGGNASSDTIAQAAFAYAMYTSYQASQGKTVSGDVNIADVYETLATDGFKNYMKNDSAADQEGYKSAMQMIADSADNADNNTAKDILQNGFNSPELVGLMQSVTK